MRTISKFTAFSCVLFFCICSKVTAGIMVPTPNCGFDAGDTCLEFDDFTVFSMSFLQFNENGSLSPNSGDTYYIDSSPGKISDDIVIMTSPAGARNNSDISPTGIDDAFNTPNSSSTDVFAMLADDEPSPTLTNDNIQASNALLPNPDGIDINGDGVFDTLDTSLSLWDIETNELTSFLGGEDLMFFFNLNETGAQDDLDSGQDMLGWLRVYLTDSTTGNSINFTLSGNNTASASQRQSQTGAGGPIMPDSILPTPDDEWAYIHGRICVSNVDGSLIALSSCNQAAIDGFDVTNGETVNQNLGANAAAFGLWSEELNSALYSGMYDTMSVDVRMSHIENGYEQLFIRAAQVGDTTVDIPEPKTSILIALSLISIGLLARKRNLSL